jgi:Spy/CpxP family protein refolding chaperone
MTNNYTKTLLGSLILLISAGTEAVAQGDPLKAAFIPPELIMRHQTALDLSEEQREQIKNAVTDLQGVVTGLEWDLQEATQSIAGLVSESRVNEDAVMSQLDGVLELENQIKRAHLTLFVRIKNVLSPEQQEKIYHIKRQMRRQGEHDRARRTDRRDVPHRDR